MLPRLLWKPIARAAGPVVVAILDARVAVPVAVHLKIVHEWAGSKSTGRKTSGFASDLGG